MCASFYTEVTENGGSTWLVKLFKYIIVCH